MSVGARRLAAIMFTDMVGFTQGAQLDERATLSRLAEQEGLVRPVVGEHQGRVVKSTGDGLLVEFPSALKATECAVTIQERLRERNRAAAGPPIELRIGIHLGDVEERGDDILGDAVNVAARVQPTAEAGGIAISQQVFDQVRNKLPLRCEPLPPQALKGVQLPVTIFRVLLPWSSAASPSAGGGVEEGRLAVLPFANISANPQDAYFSDGLTEEVIAVLSELKELRVIARTSVDHYKTTPKPIPQVAAELGVRWVLEGSVRKEGARLRFTAQLIDARTQEHVWSGRYDRELVDLFALQSELARQIADTLQIKLLAPELERLDRRRAPKPESYLEYLQGRIALHDVSEEGLRKAKGHFERAIALDDRNAAAYTGLAESIEFLASVYRAMPRATAKETARQLAARALELDPDLAEVHTMLAFDLADRYEYPAAIRELERAIALNPSYAGAHLYYAAILADLGRPEDAATQYALAEQLDPLSSLTLAEHILLVVALHRMDEARALLARLGDVEGRGILYYDRRAQVALNDDDLSTFADCLAWFDARYAGRPELPLARAVYDIKSGHPERAAAPLAAAEALPPAERPTSQIAHIYSALGDLDRCFDWIGKSIDEGRFSPRSWRYDADHAEVRADPRFGAALRRVGVG